MVDFLRQHSICAARLMGTGASQRRHPRATLAGRETRSSGTSSDEQVELLSLTGSVVLADAGPRVHAPVVVGRSDTTAGGGHLLDAVVRPTLELIVEDAPSHLRKRHDPET